MSPSLPHFGFRPALGIVLACLLLALLYTLPLGLHLTEGLPFAAVPPEGQAMLSRIYGDYLQFYYYLWLVRERLLAGASFLYDPYQFAVDGARLNLPNTFLPLALLYVPLSIVGPRLAYNLLVLLSFPLAGMSAALLVHRYGVGRWAAVVAGAVFACAPYRVGALLGGHPAGMAYFLVPLALWGLEGALAGSIAGGIWTAVALFSIAIVEPHFFYFAALGLPLYLLARIGLAGWTRETRRASAPAWTAAGLVALALAGAALLVLRRRGWHATWGAQAGVAVVVALGSLAIWQCVRGWRGAQPSGRAPILPLALAGAGAVAGGGFLMILRALVLSASVSGAGRSFHEALLFSPTPADFLTRVNPSAGHAIYPGALALALAVVGIAGLVRRALEPRQRILFAFGPLLALGVILSVGPGLFALPLFEAAFYLVPFWNFVRQPAKLQILAGLALAVLAAVGADVVAARLRKSWLRAAVPVILALLVAAEYHPWRPIGVSLLPASGEVYETIRKLGPRALYVPLWPGDSSFTAVYLYSTTLTRVPMLNGYSAYIDRRYVTEVYRALEAVNLGVVGEAEHAVLRRYGVSQVVLDRDVFPPKVSPFGSAFTLAGLRGSPFLEPAWTPPDGRPLWVFRVRGAPERRAPAAPPRSALGIYWEARSLPRETGQVADDTDASGGRVVLARAGRDRPGFVVFGPYRLLPAGPFRAVFRVRGEGSVTELQVTTDDGQRVLARREVRLVDGGAFGEVAVPFGLDGLAPVEYRVKWDGAGWLAVDHVAVTFGDVPDPAPAFEVEDLPHDLLERSDADASGGVAGYADPTRTLRSLAWTGPLRRYPAGQYRLWVRLKVDHPTTAALAWCGAQVASLGSVLGGRELLGSEVPEAGRYVELAVPFTLTRPAILELPCFYRFSVGLWLDRLRIEAL